MPAKPPAKAAALPSVDPVPSVTAPQPPTGFVATNQGRAYLGSQPLTVQLPFAAKAATEIATSTDHATAVGGTAPPQNVIADALATAAGWSAQSNAASVWLIYTQIQSMAAWKAANSRLDQLKTPLAIAVARNPALA